MIGLVREGKDMVKSIQLRDSDWIRAAGRRFVFSCLVAVVCCLPPMVMAQVPPATGTVDATSRGTVKGYRVDAARLDSLASALRMRFPESKGVRIVADARTSQLIIVASDAVHRQIGAYLQQGSGAPANVVSNELRRVPRVSAPRYKLQNITWREFERSLRSLWRESLAITPDAAGEVSSVYAADDPHGMPILRVNHLTNEISFAADEASNKSWRQIAIALDRAQSTRGGTTQLVPLQRADPAKVSEAVNAIRDAGLRAVPGEAVAAVPLPQKGRRPSATNLVSMIFQPAGQAAQDAPAGNAQDAPAAKPPAAQPGQAAGQEGQDVADAEEQVGLLGDVQIEYVPELGVIILRGNKRDVARVRAIIDEIEARSKETSPEVDVVSLEHTNSEALTEIITQIYEDVYAPRQGALSIVALVKPNAILLVGRQENIDTAKKMITKLDRPVAPDTQIKVYQLMHMPAQSAEQYIQNFYGAAGGTTGQTQQQQGRGLAPRVIVIGDIRSNSLIIQASPRDLAEVEDLLRQLDVDKTPAKTEVRIFPLQNSLATDLLSVLRVTLGLQSSGGGTSNQQGAGAGPTPENMASRSVQIVGIDQAGNKIIESGLLTDVTIAADDNSNALVVKGPANSMGLIGALIEQLDKIPSAESQIKVFQIRNGDATNLTSMLQMLFGQQVTAGQVGVFSQTVGRTFGTQQSLSQSTAGESSLIPLNFGVDARTNSIIASGSRGDLSVVEAILLRLDESDLRQRKLIVYRLNNAPAQQVADSLTAILANELTLLQQQQQQQFSLISQFEFIDQQVFVVPEIISNTLIVSATPDKFEQITAVIQDLDRRPPMIMIQVVVCLVRLSDNEEMGIELGIQDSMLFDRGSVASGLLDPGFDFVNKPLGNAVPAARGLLAGQAFGAFGVGRSSATQGFPGLVLSASNESISILIRALVNKSRAQVLSRPQIMTLNNVPASVLVGQRIPQITDFQTLATGGTVNSVDLVDTGVSLGVIPRVTPDGLIIMDIEANDSRVGDPAEGITIGVSDGIPIQSPIYDDITAITTIAARSGQTVVFGGLIQTNRTDTFRGVPFLAQLPVVGHLFRFDTHNDERTELIFFLTPHIVMDDADIEMLNQREAERMSWCLADVIEVHGDPGFQSNMRDPWSSGTPVIYPHIDPTAEGTMIPPGAGTIVVPQPTESATPRNGQPGQEPFILPPEQRTEGKPFVLPPDQRREGKPFILPPAERKPGKPFIETPRESRRRGPGTPGELLQQAGTWQPPRISAPWQRHAPALDPGSTNPPQPQYGTMTATPAATSPSGAEPVQSRVVPVQYQKAAGAAVNTNYPPPPFPTSPR